MFGVVGEWQSERDKEKNYINNKNQIKLGLVLTFAVSTIGSEHCQL